MATLPQISPNQLELDVGLEQKPTAIVRHTPADFLRIAIERNVNPDILTKFQEMYERWERNEARKAFVQAMNEFKKNPPAIVRDRQGEHSKYAGLDTVCKALMTALSQHGISHRWEYEQKGPEWISVTCILTHEAGHSERTTMAGPPDLVGPKGNATKNPIQAIASTRTYLERYTLLGAVGLESTDDDDGAGADATNGDLSEQLEWIAQANTLDELKKLYAQAYEMFESRPPAIKAIIAAKNKRKGELS